MKRFVLRAGRSPACKPLYAILDDQHHYKQTDK